MIFNSPAALRERLEIDVVDFGKIFADTITEMIKESVKEVVYDPYEGKNIVYERTHEFLNSWGVSFTDDGEYLVVGINPEDMTYAPPVHGKVFDTEFHQKVESALEYWGGETGEDDRRERMDAIIAEGTDYDFVHLLQKGEKGKDFNWWTRPRDYWTPVIEELSYTRNRMDIMAHIFKENNVEFKILA